MADYLMRDEAPLSSEEWGKIDETVVEVAQKQLVGRRFIPIFGPIGAGVQMIASDVFAGLGEGKTDVFGDEATDPILSKGRKYITLPMIYKDFKLFWRDIEASKKAGLPLNIQSAAAASVFCAYKEDDLIFNGDKEFNWEGLLNVTGRKKLIFSDWSISGNILQDVVNATKELVSSGNYGPYAMVVNPAMYTQMFRTYKNSGVLEIRHIRELVTAGVYQSSAVTDDKAVVVSVGSQNFDLVIGQDLVTAYLGPENLNHSFRVFESLALRIKRPDAICTFEKK